ncbi:MAG: hypothetical protein A3H96_10655 [Acidobacteria bacterium RIFCSPLOWO2_02_FULL_67_36]|nr:MAG: hypothetical protein A3H96_10655 [Acidobacteria bacterium RIFCSPLOWO2_02_FULL_67_36]OFW24365.1 MAG: hypothetical protein A3G21_17515 [Acidobacteria bacterium RIFCSPLOWO2_12_FULL_66_21]
MQRTTSRLAVAILVAAGTTVLAAARDRTAIPSHPDDRTIVHVLNRLGFGAAPGDIARVRAMGLEKYIDRQLHPESIADAAMTARLSGFETLGKSTEELARDYFLPAIEARRRAQQAAGDATMKPGGTPEPARAANRTPEQMEAMQAERRVLAELASQKILRAAYSDRQLEQVMADFWFNHFNVFAGKGQTRVYLTEYERDTIRPRVLGKFRDLLGATAKSPAMLFYLDNWQSAAPEGGSFARQNRPRRGLNENYARELMELHTLGVEGGYTQKDVQEVARCFTGWTIAAPRAGGGYRFEPRMHDDGGKIVLGHRIAAGGGEKDGQQVLDILASHPSTARFVATKLARRFVADDPPPALVERAAKRFGETGGDIREVVRTIVTSAEFFAPAAYRAKVKTPFEFVASAIRATGAESGDGLPLVQALRDLGMPVYQCQPPIGYADRADAWVNTGALLARMNFSVALASGRLRAGRQGPPTVVTNLEAAERAVVDGALAGDLSASTRATVAKAGDPAQKVALILGSPEFQKR